MRPSRAEAPPPDSTERRTNNSEPPDAPGLPAAAKDFLAARGLTERELALAVELAADGASEKEIARRTGRSGTAVRKGFESIRRKLGAGSQVGLARVLGVLSCLDDTGSAFDPLDAARAADRAAKRGGRSGVARGRAGKGL